MNNNKSDINICLCYWGKSTGRQAASLLPFDQKASHIANQLSSDINNEMGPGFTTSRFLPNVIMHEFEALLFSDCQAFANGIGRANLAPQLQEIRNSRPTPEHINDSPHTAPSKRIEALIPGYQKPLQGNIGIISIGLLKIQQECPNFNNWIHQLELLGPIC